MDTRKITNTLGYQKSQESNTATEKEQWLRQWKQHLDAEEDQAMIESERLAQESALLRTQKDRGEHIETPRFAGRGAR